MSEKEQIEQATAEGFLSLYNKIMCTEYSIHGYSDAPDVHCKDPDGQDLFLEITITEDHAGDMAGLMGRSEKYSIEKMKNDLEALKQGKGNLEVNALQGNVFTQLRKAIKKKALKDYGSNVALVIRDSSPICWDWHLFHEELKKMASGYSKPYDKGIWLVTYRKDYILELQ